MGIEEELLKAQEQIEETIRSTNEITIKHEKNLADLLSKIVEEETRERRNHMKVLINATVRGMMTNTLFVKYMEQAIVALQGYRGQTWMNHYA